MVAPIFAHKIDVTLFRVSLSGVLSKYIGKTEKNLNRLVGMTNANSTILFFNEAEALSGCHSEINDAHDRYANSEVAYLL